MPLYDARKLLSVAVFHPRNVPIWVLGTSQHLSIHLAVFRPYSHTRLSTRPISVQLSPREWKGASKSCSGEAEPLSGSTYPAGSPPAADIVRTVLSFMKKPVYLLDITTMSQLRKDAHPETYSGLHTGLDCSHWCLPGLPDTWNQLLYAALIM